jgi:hypothetical protein
MRFLIVEAGCVAWWCAQVRKTVKEASPNMQLWVGEAGGAFNSGRQDITGCFASSFWYLDEMATMAAHGHQARNPDHSPPTLQTRSISVRTQCW